MTKRKIYRELIFSTLWHAYTVERNLQGGIFRKDTVNYPVLADSLEEYLKFHEKLLPVTAKRKMLAIKAARENGLLRNASPNTNYFSFFGVYIPR